MEFYPLFKQAEEVYNEIKRIIDGNPKAFENGYHLMGHSQGAILLRSVIEIYGLNVENFISLSSIHGGVYDFGFSSNYFFSGLSRPIITYLFYTSLFQNTLSCANWWRDVNNENYLKYNIYLPQINQEVDIKTPKYKENFLKSINGTLYALGSKDDDIIRPWTSQFFGFADMNFNPIYMHETITYLNDTYGLQTLDKNDKLKMIHVDHVTHDEWVKREDIFVNYVLPLISK